VTSRSSAAATGFLVVEAIVAALLFAVLLLAGLSLWDSASRVNKSEIDVAEAQGGLRYGLRQVGRVVGMAGTGGLFVTQAVLVRPDPGLPGITAPPDGDYDNVVGGSVTDRSGRDVPVRPGTDVVEVRGVFFSPLLAFDGETGCGACTGASELRARAVTATGHVNHDSSRRPQFTLVDDHAAGASSRNPLFVIVSEGGDVHSGCSDRARGVIAPPVPPYRVGLLGAPTALASAGTFGLVDFASPLARELESEDPRDPAPLPPPAGPTLSRGGVLDDVLFFIDDSDPRHPVLAQAERRGSGFDVVPLVEDVEDLQAAYGVDGLYGGDGRSPDGVLDRLLAPTPADPDPHFSRQADGDEWAPNAPGERLFANGDFQSRQPPPAGFPHGGDPTADAHCPTLSAVLLTLVAKTRDPDPTFRGPGSGGLRPMNSTGEAHANGPTPGAPRYRRRSQTIRVLLRNYAPAR
jgi:hypothetical protein